MEKSTILYSFVNIFLMMKSVFKMLTSLDTYSLQVNGGNALF